MEKDYLNMLAKVVLPTQILDYFSVVGVEQKAEEIHISLDKKMDMELSKDVRYASKSFMEAVNITDFPIRDHKVILRIRRRRWLYTFVTNRDACTRNQSLIAVVAGTKSEDVISVLQRIDESKRHAVEEVTLDLSDSMRKIVRTAFPKASRVIDRFHIQRLACDAVQELRIKHRWEAIRQANEDMEKAKLNKEDYEPLRYSNGDTRKELLMRSRYLLFKSADK